jgi:hypothetical protein
MVSDRPICKNVCRECKSVLNMKKISVLFGLKVRYVEDEYPSTWLCASSQRMDCVTGVVKSNYCCVENSNGKCDRFYPADPADYHPEGHILTER